MLLTIGRREVLVGLTNVLIGARAGVEDLDIGSEILITPKFAKLVEGLVGYVGDVELVVA
jgi:hypothetical protein